jgi:hypothetical protein
MKSFIKMIKSKEAFELLKKPNAFILLTQVAYRAKRANDFNIHGLQIGEALIGDYKSIGLTEQKYRTAKAQLEAWGFATFKGTNKGTAAKLINSRVFDINREDEQRAEQRNNNEQITTNKNDKNDKNKHICPFKEVIDLFNQILTPELPGVKRLSNSRKKTLQARWLTSKKTQSLDWWQDFFNCIHQSNFLTGKNSNWRASFDWIIKEANFNKIIGGNYDNR